MIPPARPVLLIEDGYGSHISIELIKLARANDVSCAYQHIPHTFCSRWTLEFSSLLKYFSQRPSCLKYLAKNPGRIITSDVIASLVGEAQP